MYGSNMVRSRRRKKRLPLLIVLVFFAALGGVFLLRSPVLIVADPSFNQLYGPLRLTLQGIKASLELFRRVVPVTIAESAGPDLAALAVEGKSKSPWAVFFPFRYLEGAKFYKENHLKVPVLVTGAENQNPQEDTGLTFINIDTALDLYRAGSCAALLAGEKKVLFFNDGNLKPEYMEAFWQGLRDQDFSGDPVYVNVSADYSAYSEIGCVVVAGPAGKFLERNLNIPVILFSWINPALTPRSVKVVFDDSPWALAAEVLRGFSPGEGETLVSSAPVVLKDRIGEKDDFRNLQGIIKEKFQKNEKKTGPES